MTLASLFLAAPLAIRPIAATAAEAGLCPGRRPAPVAGPVRQPPPAPIRLPPDLAATRPANTEARPTAPGRAA